MRYIIGIDLGTTNCCVAYVDIQSARPLIQQFYIPQLKEAGRVESLATLPSFCYLVSSAQEEWPLGMLDLPWKKQPSHFVGAFALSHGAKVPTRLVHSAKSWLCHSTALRTGKVLPVEAAEPHERISPVEATARYLDHLREAWNRTMAGDNPEAELQQQQIVLTVPASFDEVARTLTVEAAKKAGFAHLILLEEPQAAFYAWISRHEKEWKKHLFIGAAILVCDVGGGTTDFSLIEVQEKGEEASFQRMAVGDHLLLGGDNIDEAIVHYLESQLSPDGDIEYSMSQRAQLRYQARRIKEQLLGDGERKSGHVQLLGTGSSVVQGSLSIEITKEELQNYLESGFFHTCCWDEVSQGRKGALRTMGLAYEEEPSVVKHMGAFIKRTGKSPDFVLFNGGTMKPPLFQEAVLRALRTWFPEKSIKPLNSDNLDLAVSRGAAYFGKACRGDGIKISGGIARSYYLGIEAQGEEKALTLLKRGAEEGETFESDQTFLVQPNSPVSFKLYSSHVRLEDNRGEIIPIDPLEMQLLPPIQTVLRLGKGTSSQGVKDKIPVHLEVSLTSIGTLALRLKSGSNSQTWALEFQLKSAAGQENSLAILEKKREDETYDASFFSEACQVIRRLYNGEKGIKPNKVIELLEEQIQRPKREWPLSLLRLLWDELNLQCAKRKIFMEHEARWWNLAGFLLRPGNGYPLDDFRLKDLWKTILADLQGVQNSETKIQQWICYRRIAAGLNKGQQSQLAHELCKEIIHPKSGRIEIKSKGELYPYHERIRALAALELVDQNIKVKVGNALIKRFEEGFSSSAELWALGRLGARHLAYGTVIHVLPKEIVEEWIEALIEQKGLDKMKLAFVFGQLARKTEYRELNVSSSMTYKILKQYEGNGEHERLKALLTESSLLSEKEQEEVFGESLPLGISIERNA